MTDQFEEMYKKKLLFIKNMCLFIITYSAYDQNLHKLSQTKYHTEYSFPTFFQKYLQKYDRYHIICESLHFPVALLRLFQEKMLNNPYKYSSCASKGGKRRGNDGERSHRAEERHFIFYDRTVQGRRPGSRTWTPLLALMGDNDIVFGLLEDHDSVTCGRPGIGITSCTAAYKRKVGDEGDQGPRPRSRGPHTVS